MKIILSPAKLMSLETQGEWLRSSTPKFVGQSEVVMENLRLLNTKDLEKLMHISKDLAEMNIERNLNWQPKTTKKNSIQSILAFKGEVYRGLDAMNLDASAQTYLNSNLFILSGLYGILRPSDRIMPYRLEMGSKLVVNDTKNLYQLWKDILTEYVNSKMKKNEILLNLASAEYSRVLNLKELKAKIIEIDFLDYKNGELKPIMVFFKQARGAMAKYCAENDVKSLKEVKLFNENNYTFDEERSSETKLIFIR